MEDWEKRLDGFLEFNSYDILTGPGKIKKDKNKSAIFRTPHEGGESTDNSNYLSR
jgi:hypothetical protein